MSPAVYFVIGRFLYSLIDRRDHQSILVEFVGALIFLMLAIWVLEIPDVLTRSAVMGALFLFTALAGCHLVPRHPIEANPGRRGSKAPVVAIGIIDFTWISIMAAALAFITFAQASSPFNDPTPIAGLPDAFYQKTAEDLRFVLGKTIDIFLAAGAVVAACMAILWAGQIWQGRRQAERLTYKGTTLSAIKIVCAFFWTSLGGYAWIVRPRRVLGSSLRSSQVQQTL